MQLAGGTLAVPPVLAVALATSGESSARASNVGRSCPVLTGENRRSTSLITSYRGIFTIEVGANGAVEMPPSLLAVTLHTSG